MKKLLSLSLVLTAFAAHGQAPAAATPAVVVPPLTCTAPAFPANFDKGLNKKESEAFNAATKDYKKCMDSYFDARKVVVDQHNAIAKANADAAQAAAKQFNGFVEALNARIAAQGAKKKAE